MDIKLKQKALDKVPDLAAELMQYYGDDVDIEEVIEEYTNLGKLWSTSRFIIGDLVLLNHLRRCKRNGYEITVTEDGNSWEVLVKRVLSNGDYYLVHYRPYTTQE